MSEQPTADEKREDRRFLYNIAEALATLAIAAAFGMLWGMLPALLAAVFCTAGFHKLGKRLGK